MFLTKKRMYHQSSIYSTPITTVCVCQFANATIIICPTKPMFPIKKQKYHQSSISSTRITMVCFCHTFQWQQSLFRNINLKVWSNMHYMFNKPMFPTKKQTYHQLSISSNPITMVCFFHIYKQLWKSFKKTKPKTSMQH